MGCIYLIRNTVNGKCYIGQTLYDAEKTRIRHHFTGKSKANLPLQRAIAKYGKDAFTHEILHDSIIPEFLDMLEIEAIAKYNTLSPNGYNLTTGGGSSRPSDETRRKMSEAHTGEKNGFYGKKHSDETRRKMSKARKGKKGKKHPPETRRRISEANKGKKRSSESRQRISEATKKMSAETRRKLSEAHKGKKHTPETRRKMSEARKGEKNHNFGKEFSVETRRKLSERQKGDKNHFYGKKHTTETRQKMSEAHKGKKNPNFGKSPSAETRRKLSKNSASKRLEVRRKMSQAHLHPMHDPSKTFFFSLPKDMSLREKRQRVKEFSGRPLSTVYRWIQKWTTETQASVK